jgi:eukaryotic-like serine/threonine-protein kinase
MARLRGGGDPGEAVTLARSATEIARAMPMPVGEYYGLAVQAMALAEAGDLEAGREASARAVEAMKGVSQPEGLEEILSIHARLCEQAGDRSAATELFERAREAAQQRAAKIKDPALREAYLASPVPRRIEESWQRLAGSS